jgi:hypothetical protein
VTQRVPLGSLFDAAARAQSNGKGWDLQWYRDDCELSKIPAEVAFLDRRYPSAAGPPPRRVQETLQRPHPERRHVAETITITTNSIFDGAVLLPFSGQVRSLNDLSRRNADLKGLVCATPGLRASGATGATSIAKGIQRVH